MNKLHDFPPHILIVDDVPKNVKLIGSILYEKRYKISFANSGGEALRIVKRNPPDLILLDILMPDMDGFETCRRLKERKETHDIPVIFLSALSDVEDIVKGLNIGAVDYVTKPVEREILLSRIKTHLTIRNFQKKLEEQVFLRTEELRKSEENLRITLDSIGDAVITTDERGRIVGMNPVSVALTGWSRDEALGRLAEDVFKILNSKTRKPMESPIEKVLNTNRILRQTIGALLVARDGTEYLITHSVAPIRQRKKKCQGVVLVFRDETEKLKIERQLIQSQKMEAVGTLAGGLAHDFNNVLNGIFGTVSIIEHRVKTNNPVTPEKLMEYASTMRHCCERATDMVTQLFAISRKQEMRSTTVDLNSSLKHVAKIAQNTFDKSIEIIPSYYDTPALTVADPAQIEQLLLNLFINASHAMTIMRKNGEKWGGKLEFSIEPFIADYHLTIQFPGAKEGSYWVITVRDTGIGIAKGDLQDIFTPFFTTKKKETGTGLGLSSVYNIVEQHEGFILVYSEPGMGTEFNVYLPQMVGSELKVNDQIQREEIPERDGLVLIIDDEAVLRNSAKEMLEEMGFGTITAKDGLQGLEIFKEKYRDISWILMDIGMPRMSGKELLKNMKEIDPTVKVLLFSGFKQNGRIQEMLDMGAEGFIQKPFDLNRLARVVKKYIL